MYKVSNWRRWIGILYFRIVVWALPCEDFVRSPGPQVLLFCFIFCLFVVIVFFLSVYSQHWYWTPAFACARSVISPFPLLCFDKQWSFPNRPRGCDHVFLAVTYGGQSCCNCVSKDEDMAQSAKCTLRKHELKGVMPTELTILKKPGLAVHLTLFTALGRWR